MAAKWYVYRFFQGDTCVYVGKGSGSRLARQTRRFKQCRGELVASFWEERDALVFEASLIKELAPPFNKSMNEGAEPWLYRIVPENDRDLEVWTQSIGGRQMSRRILLSFDWRIIAKQYGVNIRELLNGLNPPCRNLPLGCLSACGT